MNTRSYIWNLSWITNKWNFNKVRLSSDQSARIHSLKRHSPPRYQAGEYPNWNRRQDKNHRLRLGEKNHRRDARYRRAERFGGWHFGLSMPRNVRSRRQIRRLQSRQLVYWHTGLRDGLWRDTIRGERPNTRPI